MWNIYGEIITYIHIYAYNSKISEKISFQNHTSHFEKREKYYRIFSIYICFFGNYLKINFDIKSEFRFRSEFYTHRSDNYLKRAKSSIWNKIANRVYVSRFKCRRNVLPRTHFHVLYPRRCKDNCGYGGNPHKLQFQLIVRGIPLCRFTYVNINGYINDRYGQCKTNLRLSANSLGSCFDCK